MTARLIGRIAAQPWAIQEAALDTILHIAQREPLDEGVLAEWKQHMAPLALRVRPAQPLPNTDRAQMRDGVAIIPVAGPIFRYANVFTEMSGAVSLASLARDLETAVADSRIRAILLEIDSPGGEITGLAEAAQHIRAASAAKPLVAFVEGLGASAAYQLAAAAPQIVAAPTASLGCLGVVMVATDRRQADARSGVVRHEFVSSQTPNKRPDPATDAGRATIQATVDALAAAFLADVAQHRAMTVDELLAATNGGGLLVGAEAVAAGLADRLGTFEQTMARLAAGDVPTPRKPTPAPRASMETTMSDPAQQPAPAPAPQPVATAPEPAPQPAQLSPSAADAVAAERARAAAIQAATLPAFAELSALAMSEGWPADQFIRAQAAAGKAVDTARREGALGTLRETLPQPVPAGGADPVDTSKLPPEERAKAEWETSEAIRAEFKTLGAYSAYLKAEADGKIRRIAPKG